MSGPSNSDNLIVCESITDFNINGITGGRLIRLRHQSLRRITKRRHPVPRWLLPWESKAPRFRRHTAVGATLGHDQSIDCGTAAPSYEDPVRRDRRPGACGVADRRGPALSGVVAIATMRHPVQAEFAEDSPTDDLFLRSQHFSLDMGTDPAQDGDGMGRRSEPSAGPIGPVGQAPVGRFISTARTRGRGDQPWWISSVRRPIP